MSDTNEDIPVIVEPQSSVPTNMDNNLQTIDEQTKTEGKLIFQKELIIVEQITNTFVL